jgi:hydroxyacylglutathione hydrolase
MLSHTHGGLQIEQFGSLSDNYGYLLHDPVSKCTAAIDTPEELPIKAALERRGWALTHIFNTHHHADHTGANLSLKEAMNCTIVGPKDEQSQIPGIDVAVDQDDYVEFGSHKAHILNVGGHTKGHIAFHFAEQDFIFVGDALFVLGCGRLFEGPPSQMWGSMQKLMALPPSTTVYCAHEYSQANAKWAVAADPGNEALQARKKEIDSARAQSPPQPTVPTTIGEEMCTNPFLRPSTASLRESMGATAHESDETVWAKTRAHKDNF